VRGVVATRTRRSVTGAATRTGAIAFSDLVGFTGLTAAHGDNLAIALIERQEQLTTSVLPPDARVVKQLGDGLLLWFPDAGDALRTCCHLHELAAKEEVDGLPLWIRTGLHYGSPRVRGDDLIGHDVNVASRIADLAGEGEVLCTEAFVHAAGTVDGCIIEPVGPVFLKGVADPVVAYRVK
jgi:adenylate cyclase